jgi:hypothetical protein
MTPLIEKVTIPELFPTMAAKDFAHITGEDAGFQARAYFYKVLDGGAEFQEICAGFVPPAKKPGFAVVIGLGRNDDPAIDPAWKLGTKRISVLAEFEDESLVGMVAGMLALRKTFSPALDKGFYCDGDEALAFRIAQAMGAMEDEPFLVMIPGLYSEQATAFRDYVATLSMYRRVLDRGKCEKIRKAMDTFPKEKMTEQGDKAWMEWPAVYCLAQTVNALILNPMLDYSEGIVESDDE